MVLLEYEDPTLNEGKGDKRNLKGNDAGIFVVNADQKITTPPKGTLITLTTSPTKLPETPLADRDWIKFKNEDLVDIELCDIEGNVFETVAPGEWANDGNAFCASASVDFYGKVAAGTADTGVRVIEGK
jgi:hypothetical protein